MANAEHLAILEEGVERWNAWRLENKDARVDLSKAHLTGADLNGAKLTKADLRGAHLTGAWLIGADLTGAKLTGAIVSPVHLCSAHTLAQVTLDSSLVVEVCYRCPDKFGPAPDYEDGDPRRCGVE